MGNSREAPKTSGDLSIYLHVPFCRTKCPYCDFYSAPPGALGLNARQYFDLAIRELDLLANQCPDLPGRRLVTLYLGGGTPSLVHPAACRPFVERLRSLFEVDRALEWTLEVNPGSVDDKRLHAFLSLGVNRLSVGVQSFSDATLERLGRSHRSAQTAALLDRLGAIDAIDLAWGIDLIFGGPQQTLNDWALDLEEAAGYRPHHVSVYGLTVHEATPFHDLAQKGELELPDEEAQREMFLLARRRLTEAGYEHYEISNYAWPGHRSRHNERYWTGGDSLGLGVAAHSAVDGVRWANPPDVSRYRESLEGGRLPRCIEEPPGGRSRLGECVMLGLRRLEGIDLAAFRSRFGVDLRETCAREIERLLAGGLIEIGDGRLRLTEEGLLVADAVMAEFF